MKYYLLTILYHFREFTRQIQLNDQFEAQEAADRIYPGSKVLKIERIG
jgi:hypothetical protein